MAIFMNLNYVAKLVAFHMTPARVEAQPAERQNSLQHQLLVSLLACMFLLVLVQNAHADGPIDTPMGTVLCNIVEMVYGNLGRGLATLAVIIIGVGATLGKTSWGLALTVAVGIAVIFNAHIVVGYLGDDMKGCPI